MWEGWGGETRGWLEVRLTELGKDESWIEKRETVRERISDGGMEEKCKEVDIGEMIAMM